MSRVHAPWSDEQVESLNACQNDGRFQIWTRRDRRSSGRLVATREGWIDPQTQEICQTWARGSMTDWSWLDAVFGIGGFWATVREDPGFRDSRWAEDEALRSEGGA